MVLTAYAPVLARHRPYVVATADLLGRLDRAPFGVALAPQDCLDPTRVHSGPFLDLLQRLDALTFGPLGMSMPRWALYDCGELPGFVLGMGAEAADLNPRARRAMQVPKGYEGLVPLSMYITIPMLGQGCWLGHSICSLNEVSPGATRPGLRLLSMALGLRALGAQRVWGSTLWSSPKLEVLSRFAPLRLQAALLPAHSEPASCVFTFEVEPTRFERALSLVRVPAPRVQRSLDIHDMQQLRALQEDLQRGEAWSLVGAPVVQGARVMAPLVRSEGAR